MSQQVTQGLPVGAEVRADGTTQFRVWAPRPRTITLVLEDADASREVALTAEGDGYFTAVVRGVGAGQRYRYRVDGALLPDIASRWQADGPFGPSVVVDPARFQWTDQAWGGVSLHGQVVYELHIGTFTADGTWRAAMERLPALVDIGVTLIEVMPIAEFPGRFGWGYDGVFPYAPTRLYGTPDDLRAFVDCAHRLGLGVILDVDYNHLGPDGCMFASYAAEYYSHHYENEWGDALNFDGPSSAPVREYFTDNAAYWIADYHFDGLRLDATQTIHDSSREHLLAVIGRKVHDAAGRRSVVLIAENELQHVRLVRAPRDGGYGLDALWNDDFHHSAVVAMTGHREAYYSDHHGTMQELVSAAKRGYLFQGQHYAWQRKGRGTPTRGIPPTAFVTFLENHDQVANSGDGSRMHLRTAPGVYRAMTALFLLMPGTPMLFQGQEFAASSPFLYFADHNPELARAVQKGRAEFVAQFPSLASPEMQARLAAPHAPETFARCKLNWDEYDAHVEARRLHQDLLRLRRETRAFREQRADIDGAVLGERLFVLRFVAEAAADERLLVVNLGIDVAAGSFAEPLVAPPENHDWRVEWSSEHPDYGGTGAPDVCGAHGWRIRGGSSSVLKPVEIVDGRTGEDRG
jgi:maltooligosyltrehalose trehalohydrolase